MTTYFRAPAPEENYRLPFLRMLTDTDTASRAEMLHPGHLPNPNPKSKYLATVLVSNAAAAAASGAPC